MRSVLTVRERAYFFYLDRGAHRSYEHPGRVVLVGAVSGRVIKSRSLRFAPDGRRAPAGLPAQPRGLRGPALPRVLTAYSVGGIGPRGEPRPERVRRHGAGLRPAQRRLRARRRGPPGRRALVHRRRRRASRRRPLDARLGLRLARPPAARLRPDGHALARVVHRLAGDRRARLPRHPHRDLRRRLRLASPAVDAHGPVDVRLADARVPRQRRGAAGDHRRATRP